VILADSRARSERPALDRGVPIVLYVGWGGLDRPVQGQEQFLPSGTPAYALALAQGFRRRGYRVAAICEEGDGVAVLRSLLQREGVEVQTFETPDRSLLGHLRRYRRFLSLVRSYPGCVLALLMGYFTGGASLQLAGVLGGAAGIVRADLTAPMPPISPRQKVSVMLKDRLVDRFVVGAAQNRDEFVRLLARSSMKVDVVHTGIELDQFQHAEGSEVREALGYSPGDLIVGTVSRLREERKGIEFFVEMAGRIAALVPRARFVIVGDGSGRTRLEMQAREAGLGDRIVFTGWRADVPNLLAAMDVFVMPSLYEGGPTVVLEAMAAGRAIVATRVGMVPEVIDDGASGIIIEPGDSKPLTEAVAKLLSDDQLRNDVGERAREAAQSALSVDAMVEGYLTTFAQAVAQGRRH